VATTQAITKPSAPIPRTRRARAVRLAVAFLLACLVGGAIIVGEFTRRTANHLLHPRRLAVTATPAVMGLPFESIAFPSRDGTPLRGWYVPGTNGATVITVHGLWSNREQGLGQAVWLRRAGYGVLLFDLRASGESGGNTVTFGYREADDVLGAADYLAGRGDTDPARTGVLGESLGAATAIIAAGRSRAFAAVVADSSFTSVESMIGTSFQRVTGMPPFPFAPLVTWLAVRETGLQPADIAPLAAVPHVSPTPLFLIHGGNDTLVPAESSRALFAAAREPKQLWLLDGMEHGEDRALLAGEHERRVTDFFDRYLLRE
jgi:fermentation-respiration switch protein FrsA (DUF1100 family)